MKIVDIPMKLCNIASLFTIDARTNPVTTSDQTAIMKKGDIPMKHCNMASLFTNY